MMLASFGGSQRRRCSRGVKLLPSGKSAVGGILDLCKITSLILPPYTPYRVYARKRCCSRISSFFRATHEKGFSLPRINLRLLLNPRSRCTASRSAFDSRVPRSLRMTHGKNRYSAKGNTSNDCILIRRLRRPLQHKAHPTGILLGEG